MADPERKYLQELLRNSIGGEPAGPDPEPDLNWVRLFTLTRRHLPLPSVARQILRYRTPPETQRKQLEEFLHGARRRSGLLTMELIRLFPALEEAGCMPMILKGPALAQTVYDFPEDRFYADLDILIPADKWVTASRTLSSFGYAPAKPAGKTADHERHFFHRSLVNRTGIIVELYWDLSRPAGYYRFDLDTLYAESRIVDVTGVPIRVPSDNHQLLHAAASSVSDGFTDLRRVEDAALLFQKGSLDLEVISNRASDQGLSTILWCLLITLRNLTRVEVPGDLVAAHAPSRFRQRCLRSLGIGQHALSRAPYRPAGYGALIYWLCCPESDSCHAHLRSYIFPGEERLLELGYTPDAMPTRLARIRISIRTTWSVLRLAAYQCWRLLMHRPQR